MLRAIEFFPLHAKERERDTGWKNFLMSSLPYAHTCTRKREREREGGEKYEEEEEKEEACRQKRILPMHACTYVQEGGEKVEERKKRGGAREREERRRESGREGVYINGIFLDRTREGEERERQREIIFLYILFFSKNYLFIYLFLNHFKIHSSMMLIKKFQKLIKIKNIF